VFLPDRDAFEFVELLASPQKEAPKFLKARKEDKAKVQKSAKKKASKKSKSKIKSQKSKKSKVLSAPKRPS